LPDWYGTAPSLHDVTVVIPHLRGSNQEYLERAKSSFSQGTKIVVAANDGEMAEALNAALRNVDTDWVLVFGDDDVALEGMVEAMCGVAFDADVVYPQMLLVSEDLSEVQGEHRAWPFCGNRLQQMNFVPGGFLARTEMLRRVGGWRNMEMLEDWDLHVRMHRAGARFKPCDDAVFFYRQRKNSRNKGLTRASIAEWRDEWVGERTKPLAHFYYQATAATQYLRCILPARHLPAIATDDLWFAADKDGKIHDSDIESESVVFQYPGDQSRAYGLVVLRHNGFKVWVDVDDDYLHGEHRFMRRTGWERKIGESQFSQEGHRWIVKHADGVFVTTEELAKRYRKVNKNVVVAPNCVDPLDWRVLEGARKQQDELVRVGWFASVSHHGDAKLVQRGMEWASQRDGVQVAVMGLDPRFTFEHIRLPWTNDLSMYKLMLHSLDIGLCPITATIQGSARSDIKATEYAMAGAMPIVSDLSAYAEWKHGETCLRAKDGKDFYHHLKWALSHRDEAEQIAARAKEFVLAERNIEKKVGIWREAFA